MPITDAVSLLNTWSQVWAWSQVQLNRKAGDEYKTWRQVWSRGVPATTKSSSRSGVGSGHRDELELLVLILRNIAARYGARAGVISGSVESFATMNIRFVL